MFPVPPEPLIIPVHPPLLDPLSSVLNKELVEPAQRIAKNTPPPPASPITPPLPPYVSPLFDLEEEDKLALELDAFKGLSVDPETELQVWKSAILAIQGVDIQVSSIPRRYEGISSLGTRGLLRHMEEVGRRLRVEEDPLDVFQVAQVKRKMVNASLEEFVGEAAKCKSVARLYAMTYGPILGYVYVLDMCLM